MWYYLTMINDGFSFIDFINNKYDLKLYSVSENSYEKLEEDGLHISFNRSINMIKENILTPLFFKEFLKDCSKKEKIEKYCKVAIIDNGNISLVCLFDLVKMIDLKNKKINVVDFIIPLELL